LAVSATLLVLAAVVLLLILNRHHIPHEEAQLQRAYGGWYSDYAATVRRWL
jgi:protein-S-isoprenylcysteine O-methyltransferase Ste14